MSEVLFISAILLLLVGAMGFYFYSRVSYTDKKIGLLESILLDIKMNMDMETQQQPPPLKAPEPFEPEDSEELKLADTAMYASAIEEASSRADTSGADTSGAETSSANDVPALVAEAPAPPDYDSMSRDELNAIAEKRSLRVTKSMKKPAVINLLRESDKNTSTLNDTEGNAGVHATLSTEGSSGGAPLNMEDSADLSAETLSS